MEGNPYDSPAEFSPHYALPSEEQGKLSEQEARLRRKQAQVDRLLTRGIIFSIVWIAGFGSMYSVYLATQAHRIIRNSGGNIQGTGRVWWCYLVGGFGVLMFAVVFVTIAISK